MKFGTKSIIVKNGKVLLIKRSNYNNYKAGEWDLPGGRLEKDEKVFAGHKREVFEKTGLRIDIIEPVKTWFVERPDGKHVGLTFLSKYLEGDVLLSNEHTEHKWVSLDEINETNAADWIKQDIARALKINPPAFGR